MRITLSVPVQPFNNFHKLSSYLTIQKQNYNNMPSHFDEKSGIVPFSTGWGRWWQTIEEVHIEITKFQNLKSKDVSVIFSPHNIECNVRNEIVFKGKLFRTIHADESVWTIEDQGSLINIVLPKADYTKKEIIWEALMADRKYEPDPLTLHEMRKKIDLEHFQNENPGFDFSGAKLSKCYNELPTETSSHN